MAYKVLLLSETDSYELDCEDIDMNSIFSVSDVKDISVRKDAVKSIEFKGTKINNDAFGNLFLSNRTVSTSIANEIGFNYNPLVTVQSLVYEESILVFKGSLRVVSVDRNSKGDFKYNTVVTGGFIDFKNALQDKYLHDLDFSDLKHEYKLSTIQNSWATSTQRTDETGTLYTDPYALGSGYVYPFIDYGHTFKEMAANVISKWHILNFRPAVYLKEYFDRIFSQDVLPGFSYEVRGNFFNRFKSLIIPSAVERLRYNLEDFNLVYEKSLVVIDTQVGHTATSKTGGKLMTYNNTPTPPAGTVGTLITKQNDNILNVYRNINADANVSITFQEIKNGHPHPVNFYVQAITRPILSTNVNPLNGWEVIAEKKIILNSNQSILPTSPNAAELDVSFNLNEYEFKENTQIAVRVFYDSPALNNYFYFPNINPFSISGPTKVSYKISVSNLSIPKNDTTPFSVDVLPDETVSDVIAPTAPENIKQLDFLKSILNLFNLYVYTETTEPKKIIFQQYDDYYDAALPQFIRQSSLDWTGKVDYKSNSTIKSNLDIPKSYVFTYKEDGDYLNAEYKKKQNEIYGTKSFVDSFGVTDEKKIQLIFSPTPSVQFNSTNRLHPALHQGLGAEKKPLKTNIRILYYNGLQNCVGYGIYKDKYSNVTNEWIAEQIGTDKNQYPNTSTYFIKDGKPIEDLHFGESKEIYIPPLSDYRNASFAYNTNYSNQVTELTNSNIQFIECQMWLNELDIANLDLRTPVFIDHNDFGHGYYKVLSIEYENNTLTSKILLQKIYLGTER